MGSLTRRIGVTIGLSVVMGLGGVDLVPLAQDIQPPYWARDHSPIAAIALYNGTYDDGDGVKEVADRWGLHRCWRRGGSAIQGAPCFGRGGVDWLIGELDRRYADGTGYHRFMLILPAGHEKYGQPGIGFPSAQWHLLDTSGIETLPGSTSVRQDLATRLTPWLYDHPDAQILIYQGLRFNPAVREPWKSRLMIGSVAPDLTSGFDRQVVQENTKHWLALAPPVTYRRTTHQIGFMFDNTGPEDTRHALFAVLEDSTLFATDVRPFIGGEAIPHETSGQLIPEHVARAPWMGVMRFHQDHDPAAAWSASAGMHLGFAVNDRECEPGHHLPQGEGVCRNGHDLDTEAIHDAIRSAHARGFVIVHYGGLHDAFIMSLQP
jgi:hypothetical protein